MSSDERLARRAAAGDPAAFEAIFRRYHQDLYRFCLATVGNPQDAQDALQNTMVKVMRALPGEKRQIKLKPWLYRIAHNEAVETVRRRRDSVELEPGQVAAGPEIAETAAARERLRHLLRDLEELPVRQRAVLVMRELAGLEFAEIGAAFGTTAPVARQTLYEARLSLSQIEKGREMSCEKVTRALSNADGRVTRRRDVRAHLRSCARCRSFHNGIGRRRSELAGIAPLPIAASAGLLEGLLGGQAGAASAGVGAASTAGAASAGGIGASGAGGVAGTIGVEAGKAVATSVILKSAATVAVVAAVGASAADRGGLIDLPMTRDGGEQAGQAAGRDLGGTARQESAPVSAAEAPTGRHGTGQNDIANPSSPQRDASAAAGVEPSPGGNAHGHTSHPAASTPSAEAEPVPSPQGESQSGKEKGSDPVETPSSSPAAGEEKTSSARNPAPANGSPGSGGETPVKPGKESKPAKPSPQKPRDEGEGTASPAPAPVPPEPSAPGKGKSPAAPPGKAKGTTTAPPPTEEP